MRLRRRAPSVLAVTVVAAIATTLGASSAPATPTIADFLVFVTAGTTVEQVIPNGGTSDVRSLNFKAGVIVDNDGGEEATATVRFTLPEGLRFGSDAPDPSESCTATARTADCDTRLTIGTDPSRRSVAWRWDIVADRAGSYVLRAEITQTSVSDPDLSSNRASGTVVVVTAPPGGGSPATVSVGAVKLTPAKPRAGSRVTASVRVTAGGAAVRPTRVACSGTIGGAKSGATPRAASGTATCVYRPPANGSGKTLRGTLSFTARGTRFTKRFAVKLG